MDLCIINKYISFTYIYSKQTMFVILTSCFRQSELAGIKDVLKNYRRHHDSLVQWIETTKAQQEMMKPGQSEDRRVLSEQLNQQTVKMWGFSNNMRNVEFM